MLGDERPTNVGSDVENNAGAVEQKRRGRPPNKLKENPVEQQGFSPDQVLALLNKMNESADERMLKAIAEIRKPSAEEQAKLDQEFAKRKERAAAAVKLAMAEEQGKENAARSCPHGTTHKGTGVFKHQWR